MTRPLAVTMGDPAGIGLDITLAAVGRATSGAAPPQPPVVLYGDPRALGERAHALGLAVAVVEVPGPSAGAAALSGAATPTIAVVPVTCSVPPVPGQPDARNGAAVIGAIEAATAAVATGAAGAVVTNPIAKHVLYAAGFRHPGHTEFLGELARRHWPGEPAEPVMMLASDLLNVVPLTVHVPLADVPRLVTAELIERTIAIVAHDLARRFGIARPRIAVAGLNPHAGESGTIGREDADVVAPAVARLAAMGFDVRGPLSADTLFHAPARARYDVAVCMYHDQALIPIKTLSFEDGVNVTLGLPFVRTSPDHGTAFDIAGSGKADPSSLVAAMRMAARMAGAGVPA